MELKRFLSADGLPQGESEIIEALRSDGVTRILHYVLAPETNNIPQACLEWCRRVGLMEKSELVYGRVPTEYLAAAQQVNAEGVVALYWTCAVFNKERDVFFGCGRNTLMFFVEQVRPLDRMQLAVVSGKLTPPQVDMLISSCRVPLDWRKVASHPSPKPLLDDLVAASVNLEWVGATSNGSAGEMCARGEVDACITTETARHKLGLQSIFDYGSPDMVFFGGLTAHGAAVLRSVWVQLRSAQVVVAK